MKASQLRASILQQAVEGKLVPQKPEEGTAASLLESIRAERDALIKAGKIKKGKPLPEITEDEIPFEIPESWQWVRLGEVVLENIGGGTPDKSISKYWNGSIPWASVKDLQSRLLDSTVDTITFEGLENSSSNLIPKGNVIVCTRMGLGKIAVNLIDVAINQDLRGLILSNYISKDYFVNYYSTLIIEGGGMTVKGISVNTLHNYLLPLPPLAEQKRIVAKLEELMPLIDAYEKEEEKLSALEKSLPEKLRRSVLQQAVEGKLVPQIAEEGTAAELLERLMEKKEELIKNREIPKKAETKPFYGLEELNEMSIPDSWCWVKLSDVSLIQEGAGIRKWQYRDAGVQILCVTNILDGEVDLKKKELYISEEEYLEKYRHLTLKKGDIVTACSGGSWGKISFFDSDATIMLNTSTLRLRFFGDIADNKYLYYVSKSRFFKQQLVLQLAGMQPNFGYAHYSRIMIPLPPLSEQKRIVAKVEELMQIIDKL